MMASQALKRKNENESSIQYNNNKRANTNDHLPSTPPVEEEEDAAMEEPLELPNRPTTPPLGMTLSHYNPATGGYTSSQLNSNHEVKSPICTGMTPVYRAPFERWGSCLI